MWLSRILVLLMNRAIQLLEIRGTLKPVLNVLRRAISLNRISMHSMLTVRSIVLISRVFVSLPKISRNIGVL
jgi:hypothetical protein